jgi:FkbM family methyltransferase
VLIEVGGSRPSYLLGTAEPEVVRCMDEHIKPGDVFYDLGANVGYFSLVAAALGARVVAFEPFPDNLRLLQRNAEGRDVEVRPVAVSDREGFASFEAGPTSQDGKLGEGDLTVPTVALDGDPTFVKVDVEGAELDVVRGMRCHPNVVLVELHDEPYSFEHPVAVELANRGYRLSWLEQERSWAPHLLAVS